MDGALTTGSWHGSSSRSTTSARPRRAGAPGEQRTGLADLDTALAALDVLDTDTPAATDAVDRLRGRIEVLMEEIDITLGIEPAPITLPDEDEDWDTIELTLDAEDNDDGRIADN